MHFVRRSYILFLVLLITWPAWNSNASSTDKLDLKFKHLTMEDGLPVNQVNCIIQDRQGFIWFGSNGLCKYDGYTIKIHKPKDLNADEIHFAITSILEDKNGVLWIGTRDAGMARFDPLTEKFTRYQHDTENSTSLANPSVLGIVEDRYGMLWIATPGSGVDRFDPRTEEIAHFRHNNIEPHSLSNHVARGIFKDREGRIWVATQDGLNLLDPSSGKFIRYYHDPNDRTSISHNRLTGAMWQDKKGNIWIGTADLVINIFNPESGKFTRLKLAEFNDVFSNNVGSGIQDPSGKHWLGTLNGIWLWDPKNNSLRQVSHISGEVHSLLSRYVKWIYMDQNGLVWISTLAGGVSWTDPKPMKLTIFKNDPDDSQTIGSNIIRTISEDASGRLLIGTVGSGLSVFNQNSKQWTHFFHDPSNTNSLMKNEVRVVHASRKQPGIIWIGFHFGFQRFDIVNRRFTHYKKHLKAGNSLYDNRITYIFEDSEGIIWLGTWYGLHRMDPFSGTSKHYKPDHTDPDLPRPVALVAIGEDHLGNLWIGTRKGGVYSFNKQTEQFKRYTAKLSDPSTLSSNYIKDIFKDSRDMLWIATQDGLNRYNHQTETFERFLGVNYPLDGIDWQPSNDIRVIVEDESGDLWLGTGRGIYLLSQISDSGFEHEHYKAFSGHWLGDFCDNEGIKSSKGDIIFGGRNGLYLFHPYGDIETNPPPVVFTDLKINNSSVPIHEGGKAPLARHISVLKDIRLKNDKQLLTFEFSALDYRNPKQNHYSYKLIGLGDDWVSLGTTRSISFAQLDPGEYILHINAANSDGVWNESGTSLQVIIVPYWWETAWFKIIAIMIVIAGIVIGIRQRLKGFRERQRIIADAEQKYRTVANYTYDWEYWEDPDGQMIYVSPSFEKITGHPVQKVLDDSSLIDRLIYEEDIKIWQEHTHDRGKPSSKSIQFRIITKDKKTRWIEHACLPVYDEQKEFLGFRASNRDITDRKEAQEELISSEAKLRALIQGSTDAICARDRELRLLFWNKTFADAIKAISGIELQAGMSARDYLDAEPSEDFGELIDQVFKTGEAQNTVFSHPIPGLGSRHYEIRWSPIQIGNKIIAVTEITRDITDLVQSREEIKSRELFLKTVLSSLVDNVCTVDQHGKIISVNEAWKDFAKENDAQSPELVSEGANYLSICEKAASKEDPYAQQAQDGICAVLEKKKDQYKLEYPCNSPVKERWFLMKVVPLQREEGGVVISHTDISQRKIAEENLKYAYTEMEQNVRERTQELAESMENLKNMQSELVHSEKMAILGHLIAGVAHEINTPLGAIGSSNSNISKIINLMHERLPMLMSVLPDEHQEIFWNMIRRSYKSNKILSSAEKRQTQKKLLNQLESENVKRADLVANLLVDIGLYVNIDSLIPLFDNPHLDTIVDSAYDLAKMGMNNKNISTAIERANTIIFALKTYASKDQSDVMVPIEVKDGIDIVLTLFYNQTKRDVDIHRQYDSVPKVLALQEELNQVWTNLISNALYAMNFKGTLNIKIQLESAKQIKETVFDTAKDFIVVQITDSGKGIKEKDLSKIFEPFFTTKPFGEGTGLGLDICKQIIKKHNGYITVESKPGQTTFSVWLPV